MVSTDPIADMLSRIRNAVSVGKPEISLPYSSQKQRIATILVKNGFLHSAGITEKKGLKVLRIVINEPGANSTITEIKRLSRPGRREYVKTKGIPMFKRGRGLVIMSTSRGVMSGEEAAKRKLGGELICRVY